MYLRRCGVIETFICLWKAGHARATSLGGGGQPCKHIFNAMELYHTPNVLNMGFHTLNNGPEDQANKLQKPTQKQLSKPKQFLSFLLAFLNNTDNFQISCLRPPCRLMFSTQTWGREPLSLLKNSSQGFPYLIFLLSPERFSKISHCHIFSVVSFSETG